MHAVALNQDPLTTLGEGVRASADGREWPLPLASTDIAVSEDGGIAVVRTTRTLRNAEAGPIEVVMTFPVPGDAILTGLSALIDGRALVAVAQASEAARATYEAAIDTGRTAILHEEKLRGIHMLSLGNLPSGKAAQVSVTYAAPLSFAGSVPALRVPVTVGEVYGRSPLLPCDDLVAGAVHLEAAVAATSATALPQVLGLGAASGTVTLDRAIEIAFPGWRPRTVRGRAADGRSVAIDVAPLGGGEHPLDVSVLFDRSGSTGFAIGGDASAATVWDAMRDGLRTALAETLREGDVLRLVEFDSAHRALGEARGRRAVDLVDRIGPPQNGTEIGVPLIATATAHAGDILLVTDGKSHALDVQAVAALGRRVHAVLVGTDALDAHVSHLAALTGGMTFVAIGADVAGAVRAALASLRIASGAPEAQGGAALPERVSLLRGGARLQLAWSATPPGASADDAPDAIGGFAAGLALPVLSREAAMETAVAHGLCTHLTSLVIVDEAGAPQDGIPATRKLPLMQPAAAPAAAMVGAPMPTAIRACMPAAPPPPMAPMASPPRDVSLARRTPAPDIVALPAAGRARSGFLKRVLSGLSSGKVRSSAAHPAMPTPRPAPVPALDLKAAARQVDWNEVAPRIEREGSAAFPDDLRRLLDLVARLPAVADLAAVLGCTAEALAIALLARAAGDGSRAAARVARRILKGGEGESDALRAVGLAA